MGSSEPLFLMPRLTTQRQFELLLHLQAPLRSDGCGANDQSSTAALGPKLAENQADFVEFQGEQSGVNLARVCVNCRVEQQSGEAINIGRRPLKRQFVCDVAGVIRVRKPCVYRAVSVFPLQMKWWVGRDLNPGPTA